MARRRVTRRNAPGLANKAARLAWSIVWVLLYRPSPRPTHWWRRMLLKLFGARIESGARPYPGSRVWAPWNLIMGHNSVMADGVDCYSVDLVEIAADAVVSQRAFLCTADRDIRDPSFPLITGPITIGRKAWVAAEAFVSPGIEIGEGGVVGARSVVLEDVKPWTVVAGHPARRVGARNLILGVDHP